MLLDAHGQHTAPVRRREIEEEQEFTATFDEGPESFPEEEESPAEEVKPLTPSEQLLQQAQETRAKMNTRSRPYTPRRGTKPK